MTSNNILFRIVVLALFVMQTCFLVGCSRDNKENIVKDPELNKALKKEAREATRDAMRGTRR